MIDIHPAHKAAHSWRDFFVHIATIVIGLLIAVGLEQWVEAIHQRHEAIEIREELRREREENREKISKETSFWRNGTATLQSNLRVLQYLQQHPGTPRERMPGTLDWALSNMIFTRAAWDSAQQTGIIKLLPQQEVTDDSYLYLDLRRIEDASGEAWRAINDAEEFTLTNPDPTLLTPEQLASVTALTRRALAKQVLYGEELENLNGSFPDLPPTVTRSELDTIRGRNSQAPVRSQVGP